MGQPRHEIAMDQTRVPALFRVIASGDCFRDPSIAMRRDETDAAERAQRPLQGRGRWGFSLAAAVRSNRFKSSDEPKVASSRAFVPLLSPPCPRLSRWGVVFCLAIAGAFGVGGF